MREERIGLEYPTLSIRSQLSLERFDPIRFTKLSFVKKLFLFYYIVEIHKDLSHLPLLSR